MTLEEYEREREERRNARINKQRHEYAEKLAAERRLSVLSDNEFSELELLYLWAEKAEKAAQKGETKFSWIESSRLFDLRKAVGQIIGYY